MSDQIQPMPERDHFALALAQQIVSLTIAAQREIEEFRAAHDWRGAHAREDDWREQVIEACVKANAAQHQAFTYISKELQDILARSLRLESTIPPVDTPLPAGEANREQAAPSVGTDPFGLGPPPKIDYDAMFAAQGPKPLPPVQVQRPRADGLDLSQMTMIGGAPPDTFQQRMADALESLEPSVACAHCGGRVHPSFVHYCTPEGEERNGLDSIGE